MPSGTNHLIPFKFRLRGKILTFYATTRDEARQYAKRWARRHT